MKNKLFAILSFGLLIFGATQSFAQTTSRIQMTTGNYVVLNNINNTIAQNTHPDAYDGGSALILQGDGIGNKIRVNFTVNAGIISVDLRIRLRTGGNSPQNFINKYNYYLDENTPIEFRVNESTIGNQTTAMGASYFGVVELNCLNLSNGTHTLDIEADGQWVVVDWVEIVQNTSNTSCNRIESVKLYDSNQEIGVIQEGSEFDIAYLGTELLTIVSTAGGATQKIDFSLSGAMTASRSESQSPYALFGDVTNAGQGITYLTQKFVNGAYTITVTPYDASNNAGTAVTINFTLIGVLTNHWNGSLNINSTLYRNGKVAIGNGLTDVPSGYQLGVIGKIITDEVRLALEADWPDYVFEEDYKLRPLAEVAQFIKENQHLPEVPSQEQVEKEGIQVGEMQATLLKKIEELTLYIIEQDQEKKTLEARLSKLEMLIKAPKTKTRKAKK